MKRLGKNIFIFLILLGALFFVGCKGKTEPKEEPKKEEVRLIIDGKAHLVEKGITLEDALQSVLGDTIPEVEDYDFKGWFSDINLTLEVSDLDISLQEDYYIYGKYIHQAIRIENLINFTKDSSEVELKEDLIFISPSYMYGLSKFDLSDYKTFIVTYDMKTKVYVVIGEDEERLPYDGFLVLVKKDCERFLEYLDCFEVGREVYLNNYNIDYASFILFEGSKKDYDEINISVTSPYLSVYDVDSDKFLYSKGGTVQTPPASVTKIITALTALKYCPLLTTHTVGAELSLTYEASSPSVAGLQRGQTWTLWQLLFALMLPSGNDAAYEIGALTIDYLEPNNDYTPWEKLDKFANLMNETAKYVGALNSHFMIPDGNTYSGARFTYHYVSSDDMCRFALLGFNCAALARVVRTYKISFTIESGQKFTFTNTNPFINPDSGYKGAIGMKTGYTGHAGSCLVVGVYKNGRFIIVSCLKAASGSDRNASINKALRAVYGS